MTSPFLRATCVLLALVCCAWFVVGVRQARDTDRATAIISNGPPVSAAQAQMAGSLLHSAGFLNPDSAVDVLRAELAAERGHGREAQSILLGVVSREPLNPHAWESLAAAAVNRTVYVRSLIEVARLVPRVPKSS